MVCLVYAIYQYIIRTWKQTLTITLGSLKQNITPIIIFAERMLWLEWENRLGGFYTLLLLLRRQCHCQCDVWYPSFKMSYMSLRCSHFKSHIMLDLWGGTVSVLPCNHFINCVPTKWIELYLFSLSQRVAETILQIGWKKISS